MQKILALITFGLIGLFFFSNHLNFFSTGSSEAPAWGRVLKVQGRVMGRGGKDSAFKSLKTGASLSETHKIVTTLESEAHLDFGGPLVIRPNSSILLEKRASLFKVYLLAGALERPEVRETQPIYVNNKISTRLNPSKVNQYQMAQLAPFQVVQNTSKQKISTKLQARLADTFKLHRRFLEKCFIKHFDRQNGDTSSGQVLAQFRVLKKGTLTEIKIKKSDFQDEKFHTCIQDVISRIKVKFYDGKERVIFFPIQLTIPGDRL